ncbi:acyl-CoA carboxylase subunit epsilon [Arthrobacter sp. TMS2-4]
MTGHEPLEEGAAAAPSEEDPAVLSVVSGNPTDEELAALTAVVLALQEGGTGDDVRGHGRSWLRRALLRLGPTPGPGSWRRSVR